MIRKLALLAPLLGLAVCLLFGAHLSAAPLKVSSQFGNLKFSQTISPADQKYLGLTQPGAFTLQDVRAPYILIEVLNANCPHCMEQAPAMNRLYRLVEGSELKGRLKFIGVVSNSQAAAQGWKKDYKVPFALVADPDWEIGTTFNITGTPTTVVVDKAGQVIVLHDGVFSDANRAFKQLQLKLK